MNLNSSLTNYTYCFWCKLRDKEIFCFVTLPYWSLVPFTSVLLTPLFPLQRFISILILVYAAFAQITSITTTKLDFIIVHFYFHNLTDVYFWQYSSVSPLHDCIFVKSIACSSLYLIVIPPLSPTGLPSQDNEGRGAINFHKNMAPSFETPRRTLDKYLKFRIHDHPSYPGYIWYHR